MKNNLKALQETLTVEKPNMDKIRLRGLLREIDTDVKRYKSSKDGVTLAAEYLAGILVALERTGLKNASKAIITKYGSLIS